MLVEQLASLLHLTPESSVLVVGLGNWKATPDALGPRVVEKLLVTRHLQAVLPPDVAKGLRSVAAIAPGAGTQIDQVVRGLHHV